MFDKIESVFPGIFSVRRLLAFSSLIIFSLQPSCAKTSGDEGIKILLKEDSFVTVGKESTTIRKKDDTIFLKNEPLLVERPGKAGLYLVPSPKDMASGSIEVNLRPLEKWSEEEVLKKINLSLSDVISKYSEIQVLLSSGKTADAIDRIEALKVQYPELTFLNFIHASALTVANEPTKALLQLEKALRDFPDNREGKDLFDFLKKLEAGRGVTQAPVNSEGQSAGSSESLSTPAAAGN